MRLKRSVLAPLVVSAMALMTGGWFLQRGVSQEQNVYVQAKLFQEVVGHVSDRFVDKKDPSQLYQMAIDGMLEELGDPHTTFMSPEDYGRLRVSTQGEYGGLGIQIDKRDGWITVMTPLPGTPAERAGIMAGDQIVEFNGKTTKEWTTDDAVNTLRGPRGSTVEIKVMRLGNDQPITFKLTREEIQIKSVPTAYMLEPGIGFVELSVFSESSTDELRAAIANLRKQGAKGLILDMRNNPGGLLDQGVTVSDMFLNQGQLVVETRGRTANQNHKAVAQDPDEYPGMPIAVLVNPFSASAAEIVAGALQDHDRALVVGRTSYGKGSVQQVFQLANQNYLKMTTARWYTPVGRSIQREYGIGAMHAPSRENEEESPDGAEPGSNDSTKKPAFKTDGGRTVYGGGGIHPDVIVIDSATTAEKVLVEELNKHATKVVDARFRFGRNFVRQNANLQPGFAVTPEILNAFYSELQNLGVKIDRAVYDNARNYVSTMLAYEISLAKWGNAEARKRLNADAEEVRVAAELLRNATSPKSLFGIADAWNAQHAARPVAPRR